MHSPAEMIRQLIIDLGYAEESDTTWPIFTAFLPDLPHEAICVYDTAGIPDGRLMEDGTRIEHHGIQIRVRGREYDLVQHRVNEIALALDSQGRILVVLDDGSAYVVHNVSRTGTIFSVGIDEQEDRRRHHFTINAVVTVPNLEDYFLRATEDGNLRVTGDGKYRLIY